MPFLVGLLVGFAAGYAGATLFAPDKSRRNDVTLPAAAASANGSRENGNTMGALRRTIRSLQDQFNVAMEEAKQASEETEAEMRAKYEQSAKKATAETEVSKKK